MLIIALVLAAVAVLMLTLGRTVENKEPVVDNHSDISDYYRSTGRASTDSGSGTSVYIAKNAKEKRQPSD